jgi:hypothetical protein
MSIEDQTKEPTNKVIQTREEEMRSRYDCFRSQYDRSLERSKTFQAKVQELLNRDGIGLKEVMQVNSVDTSSMIQQ